MTSPHVAFGLALTTLCLPPLGCARSAPDDGASAGGDALSQTLTPAATIEADAPSNTIGCVFQSSDPGQTGAFRQMVGISGQGDVGFGPDLGVFFLKAPVGTKVFSDGFSASDGDGTDVQSPDGTGFQIVKTNAKQYVPVIAHTGVASARFEIPGSGGSTRTLEKSFVFNETCSCAVDVSALR